MKYLIVLFLFSLFFCLKPVPCSADRESDAYYDKVIWGEKFMESVREAEEEERFKAECRYYDPSYGSSSKKDDGSGFGFFQFIAGLVIISCIMWAIMWPFTVIDEYKRQREKEDKILSIKSGAHLKTHKRLEKIKNITKSDIEVV